MSLEVRIRQGWKLLSSLLTSEGAVLSTRTLTAAGLVTGGGDLSANRTFTVTAAVQADQETGTSNAVAVTPGIQHQHKSAIKAWALFDGTTTGTFSPTVGYGVTSITRASAGVYTVNLSVTFSSANFLAIGSAESPLVNCSPASATTVSLTVRNAAGTFVDAALISVMCAGDF